MSRKNSTGYRGVYMLPRFAGQPLAARFHIRPFKKTWMQHRPGEPGFEAEHQSLLAQIANKTLGKPEGSKKGHINEAYGSVGQLAADYFSSKEFAKRHRRTQRDNRAYIERVLQAVIEGECDDRPVGQWGIDKLSVRRMILVRDACPAQKRKLGEASVNAYLDRHTWGMRALFNWGIVNGWQSDPHDEATALKFNPAAKIKPLSRKGRGWHVWSAEEVVRFIKRHPKGTMPYLALMLLLFTVVRRSDVVRLGEPMLRDSRLEFVEVKGREDTLKPRNIELRPEIVAAINALPAIAGVPGPWHRDTFLCTSVLGRPFSPDYFSHTFEDWAEEAGIPHCTPHGVRKFVATAAGRLGEGDLTIAGLLGHTSTKNVGEYTKDVAKDAMFEAGLAAVFGAIAGKPKRQRPQLRIAA